MDTKQRMAVLPGNRGRKSAVLESLVNDSKNWLNLSIASENKYLVLKRQVKFRIIEQVDITEFIPKELSLQKCSPSFFSFICGTSRVKGVPVESN